MNELNLNTIRAEKLRELVRGAGDIQRLRIQSGNRICANYYRKLGLKSGQKLEDFLKEIKIQQDTEVPLADYGEVPESSELIKAKNLLLEMRREYKLLSGGILLNQKQIKNMEFPAGGVIADSVDFVLVEVFAALLSQEERLFKHIETVLHDFPIYTEFLAKVRGIGPSLAGILISEIDPNKARYPSSLHKLAGLDVVITARPELVAEIEGRMASMRGSIVENLSNDAKAIRVHGEALKEINLYADLYRTFADNVGNSQAIMEAAEKLCAFKNDMKPINRFVLAQNDNEGNPITRGTVTVADLTVAPKLNDATLHKMQDQGIDPAPYYELLYVAKELMTTNKVEGRSRKAHHLVDTTYIDRNGEEQTKKGLTYKPLLKKTMYLLATSFLKAKNETYAPIYRDYRARLELNPKWQEKTKAHKNLAALRFMSKVFLSDLYQVWRTLEGLPVFASYEIAKLGYSPHRGEIRPSDWFKHLTSI